jgi:alginate O-acetyltransferase complex protein AlgI
MLLIMSLGFYAWGERKFVLIMMASIAGNYLFALAISAHRKRGRAILLWLDVAMNVGILFVFKYLGFTVRTIDTIAGAELSVPQIALPIGISFFTFQAMSYVIDVYRGTTPVQKNPFYVALYISFFPQLIAGPIVRYNTIADQILVRTENIKDFSYGCRRFIIGLCKKVLIANQLALLADTAFSANAAAGELTVTLSWMGVIAYAFQIYFDFSGYSDMAIGLGRMFGFHFEENFNYPYISKTVTEFWRRWHISLGTWFRDYVYFPLGGSRVKSRMRLILNLFVVWLLTGIWHGAHMSFVLWGGGGGGIFYLYRKRN